MLSKVYDNIDDNLGPELPKGHFGYRINRKSIYLSTNPWLTIYHNIDGIYSSMIYDRRIKIVSLRYSNILFKTMKRLYKQYYQKPC